MALRDTIHRIGICAVAATILGPPLAFLGFGYSYERDTARTVAATMAARFERRAWSEPEFHWTHFNGITQIDQAQGPFGRHFGQRLLDTSGALLLTNGIRPPAPTITVAAPVQIRGQDFGRIEFEASLRPLLILTLLVSLASTILGALVWLLVHRFPLRVLDRTLCELKENSNLLDAALNNMAQGLSMIDARGRLVVCNRKFADMYQLPDELTRRGTPLAAILHYRASRGLHAGPDPDESRREAATFAVDAALESLVHELPDGRVIAVAHRPLPDGGVVSTHEDITEQRELRRRLDYLAERDALTGLVNRANLRHKLKKALEQPGRVLAVLYVDPGRLQDIKDIHGQTLTDALLKAAAGRLSDCATSDETIARAGERFALIQLSARQPEAAAELAARVYSVLNAPFEVEGRHILLAPRIGVAVAPWTGRTRSSSWNGPAPRFAAPEPMTLRLTSSSRPAWTRRSSIVRPLNRIWPTPCATGSWSFTTSRS